MAMSASFRTLITLPEKDRPYTEQDMDVVIGLPVVLQIGIKGEPSTQLTGTITDAVINADGSATVTAEVSSS